MKQGRNIKKGKEHVGCSNANKFSIKMKRAVELIKICKNKSPFRSFRQAQGSKGPYLIFTKNSSDEIAEKTSFVESLNR